MAILVNQGMRGIASDKMKIRKATIDDFEELYALGKRTPELRVSATEGFMDADEFKWSIKNPDGIFLLAEDRGKVIGFVYANAKDKDRAFENRYACLVYLTVDSNFRRKKIGERLYLECEKQLKKLGITNIYGWATLESKGGILRFMEKQGYAEGHKYVWVDKKL